MVSNYLGNVRRTIQRMTNFIDNQRSNMINIRPRESESALFSDSMGESSSFNQISQSILDGIQTISKRMHEFTIRWTKIVGKQQSPLIDRIPPRGVELWRDFWDTVRKQIRVINQQFSTLAQDMGRMLTGRLPTASSMAPRGASSEYQIRKQFQELHDNLELVLGTERQGLRFAQDQSNNFQDNLIDEQDDEATRNELNNNIALRQQIQQEINMFGSIFDIMRAFIQRLRESATNAVRDVLQPGATNNNDNNPVTPGPSVKPQVDKLLGETINSQRNINGQAKPVLMPNVRPAIIPTNN